MDNYELAPSSIERIKKICADNNWTPYRFAQITGIPYSSINNMFKRNTDPTINTLCRMCYALNITLSEFFSDSNIEIFPIDEELKPLLSKYNDFSELEKAQVKTYIQGIADRH